ncbi:MAG: sigma-70 family RNA polymerase sigma factor [Fimbriiglobus sp.]|nr:sigma-70 family RNA polymerase sigma factor [Fimbriiglobus sp.]
MARLHDLLASLLRRRTPESDPLPDAALLDRFARSRDPAAFELLVWRHGPMVLAACRRVLRNDHAAEDAFQAAFLVLARKAGTVRGSVAGWLHRVALRVCLRMKRRLPPVALDADPTAPPDPDSAEAAERSAILDEEVGRLPEWLRLPVIVCYLQGHSTEQAAAQLGIPRGTVLSRLATAKKRLVVRLTARGVTATVAVVAVAELSADAGRTVAEAAVAFALGTNTIGVPVQLALEVLAMTTRTTVTAAVGLFVLAGLGTGLGLVAAQGIKPTPTTGTPEKPPEKKKDDPDAVRRQRIEKMLDTVDKQLLTIGTEDIESLRRQLEAATTRLTELKVRGHGEQAKLTPEQEDELRNSHERVELAKTARVPGDVLAEAVKLHPKAVEVQKKLTAKEDELRNSKLPKQDAGRKKLDDERLALFKQLQTVREEVSPEVEAYLRVPAVVEATKARAVAERKVEQIIERDKVAQLEVYRTEEQVMLLRAKVAKLEPQAEEMVWLKEKRKRLKQELFELELKELGIGK